MYGEMIDHSICDKMIDIFESTPDQHQVPGHVGVGRGDKDLRGVVPWIKDSQDIASKYLINHHESTTLDYITALNSVTTNYKISYPLCDLYQAAWSMDPDFNLQKYNPGQGFKVYHCENSGGDNINRHLVFMTYLNDVPDGGTHWSLQDFYCPAVKGMTVIWPAQWMFTHKGIVSNTATKYILTGWFVYDKEKN
jgi:hypothetical protein